MTDSNSNALAPRQTTVVQRSTGFGSTTQTTAMEMARESAIAQARATVEARFIMASQFPRSRDTALARIVEECKRSDFAEVALYRKPIGGDKKLVGFSIRFAEAMARVWKNLDTQVTTLVDDTFRRMVRVTVTDLESNVTDSLDAVIEKSVERRGNDKTGAPPKGRDVYGERFNSYGDKVFIVAATDDEVMTKQLAMISKLKRNLILSKIDGDILAICRAKIDETAASKGKVNPQEAKQSLVLAFADLRVMPADLEQYLGHGLDRVSPAELKDLREVFSGIREGEGSWEDFLQGRLEERGEAPIETSATPQAKQTPASAPTTTVKAEPAEDATPIDDTPPGIPAPKSTPMHAKFWKMVQELGGTKRETEETLRSMHGSSDFKALSTEQLQATLDALRAKKEAHDEAANPAAVSILDQARRGQREREPGEDG